MIRLLFSEHYKKLVRQLLSACKKVKKNPSPDQLETLRLDFQSLKEHLQVADWITAEQHHFTQELASSLKVLKTLNALLGHQSEAVLCEKTAHLSATLKRLQKKQSASSKELLKKLDKQLGNLSEESFKKVGKGIKKGLKYFENTAFCKQLTGYVHHQLIELEYWKQHFSEAKAVGNSLKLTKRITYWFGFLQLASPDHAKLRESLIYFKNLESKLGELQNLKAKEKQVASVQNQLKPKETDFARPALEAEKTLLQHTARQLQLEVYRMLLHQKGIAPHRWRLV